MIYREWDMIQRDKAYSYAKESNRMQRALIIPDEIIAYPADWPEISFRRGEPGAYDEPPENREVLASLETRRIPASFASAPLEDVIEFIAAVGNLNVDVDWDSLANIGVNRDTEVTLNLRPVPMRVVLNRVLEKVSPDEFSRAGWAVTDGVLVVASDEALRRNTFIRIYDIQDLIFEIPNYTDVPQLDLDAALQQSGGGGGGGGGRGVFQVTDDTDIQITDAERIQNIINLIQTNVDFEGWQDNGGTTGRIQQLNGNLIITNTAKNHREIANLLRQLREIRELQINVEALPRVAQDFFEQIGFDLDIYFNAQNNQYDAMLFQERAFGGTGFNQVTPAGSTSSVPSDLVGRRQTDTVQWNIANIDQTTGEIEYQFTPLNTSVVAPDGLSIIPVQQGSLGLTETLASGSARRADPREPRAGHRRHLPRRDPGRLPRAGDPGRHPQRVAHRAPPHAGQQPVRQHRRRQPRAYVSDLQPVVSTSSVGFDPTVSTLNTGVTLLLRGVVSSDRRYVTLSIDTRISQLVTFRNFTVTAAVAGGGDGGGGSATAEGQLALPEITISSIQTAATIPDQGTILLGGRAGHRDRGRDRRPRPLQDAADQPLLQQPHRGQGRAHAAHPAEAHDPDPERGRREALPRPPRSPGRGLLTRRRLSRGRRGCAGAARPVHDGPQAFLSRSPPSPCDSREGVCLYPVQSANRSVRRLTRRFQGR